MRTAVNITTHKGLEQLDSNKVGWDPYRLKNSETQELIQSMWTISSLTNSAVSLLCRRSEAS